MKYCSSRVTARYLEEVLEIPGTIASIEFDPRTRCIDIYFYAEGQEDIAEGQEVVRKTPDQWRRDILKEELDKKWV